MSAKNITRLKLLGVFSLILPVELWAVGLAAELVNSQDMLSHHIHAGTISCNLAGPLIHCQVIGQFLHVIK